MTKPEFLKIVGVLKANYTDPKFLPDSFAYDVWYSALKDLSALECQTAVLKWMSTSRYTPTIADLRQMVSEIRKPEEDNLTPGEAWSLVDKTIRDMRWERVRETYDSLPMACRMAIGSPARLREMAMEEDAAAQLSDRAKFMTNYQLAQKRIQTEAQIPPQTQGLIDEIRRRSKEIAEGSSNKTAIVGGAQGRNETDNQNSSGPAAIPGRADEGSAYHG